MKYFALNVECSRETFENVAKDIARYMFDHDYRPYRIRDSMFNCMPVYVDGHMTFFCQASKTDRYTAITLEQMDEIVQIFDSHRAEYAAQEDANTMIAWSGTRSKRGYLHWYRVTDEGFLSGDYMKCSVSEYTEVADNYLLDKARAITLSFLITYHDSVKEAYKIFDNILVSVLKNEEINLDEYKLYGMTEWTAQALCVKKYGKTVDIDYDMGCVNVNFSNEEDRNNIVCENDILDDAIAYHLGVDPHDVRTFCCDGDQLMPNDIMVIVRREDS